MVIKIALGWSGKDLSRGFERLLGMLDDDSYKVREGAQEKIRKLILKDPKIILLALNGAKDAKLSEEQRSRLNSILEDERYKRILKCVKYIKKERLYKDPEYLSTIKGRQK
jgi:hypothetical protein